MTEKPKRKEYDGFMEGWYQKECEGYNCCLLEYDQWLKGRLAESLVGPNYELRRKIEALLREASQ